MKHLLSLLAITVIFSVECSQKQSQFRQRKQTSNQLSVVPPNNNYYASPTPSPRQSPSQSPTPKTSALDYDSKKFTRSQTKAHMRKVTKQVNTK